MSIVQKPYCTDEALKASLLRHHAKRENYAHSQTGRARKKRRKAAKRRQ